MRLASVLKILFIQIPIIWSCPESDCLECIDNTWVCINCEPGTYISSTSQCYSCSRPCKTCSGTSTNCTSCVDPANQSIPSCACNNYQIDTYDYYCRECPHRCATCTAPQVCSSCINYYYLSGTSCLYCSGPCMTCIGDEYNCIACWDSKQIGPPTCACQAGYYLGISFCYTCKTGCATCTSDSNCQSCVSDAYYFSGTSCLACTQPCATCSGSLTNCLTCILGYYLSDTQYNCQLCQNPCKYCTSITNCTLCFDTYYLSTTSTPNTCLQCVSPCLNCTSSTDCTSCISNYLLQGTACNPCTKPCENCSGSLTNCTSCIDINQITPTCDCNNGYLMDSFTKLCIACIYPCATCVTTVTNCLSCASTYTYQSSTHTCTCLNNQFEQSGSPNTCQNCTSPCLTCDILNTSCTSCITGLNRHHKPATNQCVCDEGYYDDIANGSSCSSCQSPCQNCIDNQAKCTSCVQNQVYSNNTCSCLSGYYADSSYICQLCIHPCSNCIDNQNKCLSCASTFILSVNICKCQDGYYEELSDNPTDCKICTQPCNNCINTPTHCTSCIDANQFIDGSNQCICKSGYIPNGSICDECLNPCIWCSGTTSNCTKCKDSHHQLNSGQCKCENGWLNDSNYDCQPCIEPCKTCSTDTTHCESCTDINHQINGLFQCYCKNKYYSNTISTCNACTLPCDNCNINGCLTCIDINQIIDSNLNCICKDGYFMNGVNCTQCQLPCVNCIALDKCLTCIDIQQRILNYQCICYNNYLTLNNHCYLCQLPCTTCEHTQTICTSCSDPNHIIINDQCVCNDGYVSSDNTGINCTPCEYPCAKCIVNPSKCTSCINQGYYYLENNQCYCQTGLYKYDNQCLQCQPQCKTCSMTSNYCLECSDLNHLFQGNDCYCRPGYYTGLSYKCEECQLPCDTCTINYNYCTSCISQLHNLINYKCICIDGYYFQIDECVKCKSICTKCQTYNICTDCIDGYYYKDDQCLQCDKMCNTCIIDSYNCLSCSDGFYMNDQNICTECISYCKQCIDSYTCDICFDNAYKQDTYCIQCSQNCQSCINQYDNCVSCNQNYQLINNQCFCNKGYYEQQQSCHKCNYPCIECKNAIDCLKCDQISNLIMNNNICKCEDGYYWKDNKCQICDQFCLTCIETSENCQSCDSLQQRTLQGNKCQCMQNYFEDENLQCFSCYSDAGKIVKDCKYKDPTDGIWTYGEECDDGNDVIRDGCTYFKIDKDYQCKNVILQKSFCYKCPENCQLCDLKDDNQIVCNTCNEGYFLNLLQCVKCSLKCLNCEDNASNCIQCRFIKNIETKQCQLCEANNGYYSNLAKNQCYTICGDSIQANNEECDDGNKIDGDGCNSKCKKESNYLCKDGQCISLIHPIPQVIEVGIISQFDGKRQFLLNYNVKLKISREFVLINVIKAFIIYENSTSLDIPIDVSQEFNFDSNNFANYSAMITLLLKNDTQNSKLMVQFIDVSSIISYEGYIQQVTNITTTISDYILINTETEEQVAVITSQNQKVIIFFGIMAGLSLILGGLDIFYSMLDTVQLLSYLIYLNVDWPYNLQDFFQLFSVAQFTNISQNSKVQNIINKVIDWSTAGNIETKISEELYKSLFIINAFSIILFWLTLITGYIAANILIKIINVNKPLLSQSTMGYMDIFSKLKIYYLAIKIWVKKSGIRVRQEFFYSGIVRAQLTTSFDLSYAIIIQLMTFQKTEDQALFVSLSQYLAIFAVGLYILCIYFTAKILNLPKYMLKIQVTQQKYGAVFEGIKERRYSKYFNTVSLIKKMVFMIILILGYSYALFQVLTLTLLQMFQLTYILYFKPIIDKLEMSKLLISEISQNINMIVLSLLVIDTEFQYLSQQGRQNLGWCCISFISIILITQIIIDLIQQWRRYIKKFQLLRKLIDKLFNRSKLNKKKPPVNPFLFQI